MGTAPHVLMAVQDEVLQRIEADSNSEVDLREPQSVLPRLTKQILHFFCILLRVSILSIYVRYVSKSRVVRILPKIQRRQGGCNGESWAQAKAGLKTFLGCFGRAASHLVSAGAFKKDTETLSNRDNGITGCRELSSDVLMMQVQQLAMIEISVSRASLEAASLRKYDI